ncbi:RraA family protein [Mycetocola saprophilus]|uniref:RraA family protein n=1 Tax=Mycetocola saprophilus TaxID=76636 RepID=UPI003BF09527
MIPTVPQPISTAAVSDAMDSLHLAGWLRGISARVPTAAVCGPAYTVTYRGVDPVKGFRGAANYIDDVPDGAVVIIDNGGSTAITTWGSLLTTVARARGIAGTVIHGAARDIGEIRAHHFPLFSTAVGMTSGKNRVELAGIGLAVNIHGVGVHPGDLIVADDNGVIAVPAARAAEVLRRAHNVALTEERIAKLVASGVRLDEARRRLGYDQPWKCQASPERI